MSALTKQLQSKQVTTNSSQGRYRPFFFDYTGFNISKVIYNSNYFKETSIEQTLLQGTFSFAYLREDKLRTIDAFDENGNHIQFKNFLNHFGIGIKSKNLFKTGKYLSRVFRPVRYGSFFRELDVHVNKSIEYKGAVTDGISLISLELAKSLGWQNAQPAMSAQFTLFYNNGLVKGHCVVSDKIEHDVVVYGNENIKSEITLKNNLQYIGLEPVSLGKSLRIDIQSLLNLWGLFGGEQYLHWAYTGIEKFKNDLFAGKIKDWLDNINDITGEDYESEKWVLRKAIYHNIDYRQFPGLFRVAWTMFKTSMITFAEKSNGNPSFKIPVHGGKRGYLRVDLRDHDKDGNFKSQVNPGEIELDKYGNIWVNQYDTSVTFDTLGGADQDDSAAVIPVENNKAIIFRNPNQLGEYSIMKFINADVELDNVNKLAGCIPVKKKNVEPAKQKTQQTGNSLLDSFLTKLETSEQFIPYNTVNLLRTFSSIETNSANVGLAANAEMIRSCLGITNDRLLKKLIKDFNWNLERIIDSTVKDGISSEEDMKAVKDLLEYVINQKIKLPKSIIHRLPKSYRKEAVETSQHPLDELFEAIKFLINKADIEILGRGTASKNNRVPGKIDYLDTPVMEIGLSNINNPMHDVAVNLMKHYNKSISIMLDKIEKSDTINKNNLRKVGIEQIQLELLDNMKSFSGEERVLISKVFAYQIYRSNRSVHDSILWIRDREGIRGTAADTIKMLADIGISAHVKRNGSVKRYYEIIEPSQNINFIRVWTKEEIKFPMYNSADEILIESRKVLISDIVFELGDECRIEDGVYKIKNAVQSTSMKNNNRLLKNSLTIYLD